MSNIGNKKTMSQNLMFYIEKSGHSQREIADIVGVASSTFNDWVKGRKYPRIDKIEILANYFGILKSDLIEDKTAARAEMQKKNDTLSDIVLKSRSNADLMYILEKLRGLDDRDIARVKSVLDAFLQ